MSGLRIGVIVDDPGQITTLRNVVAAAGHDLPVALEFERSAGRIADAGVDAWVINLDIEALEASHPEPLDAVLDAIRVPLILCEGSIPSQVSPEFANWKRRLLEKLRGLDGVIQRRLQKTPLPHHVWVLAGSLGGPEAVKAFLDALPADLGVAFVYANHFKQDFDQLLAQVVGRNSAYPAYVPRHGDLLQANSVAVISPDHVSTVSNDGSFNVRNVPWAGQYRPNLDQVVATTAVHFGKLGGVIVFSGMCDDAAAACRIMRRCGGQVWIQRQDSCVCAAMPDAATDAVGRVDFTGTPTELAAHLAAWVQGSGQVATHQRSRQVG